MTLRDFVCPRVHLSFVDVVVEVAPDLSSARALVFGTFAAATKGGRERQLALPYKAQAVQHPPGPPIANGERLERLELVLRHSHSHRARHSGGIGTAWMRCRSPSTRRAKMRTSLASTRGRFPQRM